MTRSSITPWGGLYGGPDPFLSLHREMNRLFDDAFRGAPRGEGQTKSPGSLVDARMNVSETEKELRVTAELPGVNESDVDISLDDDVLTIRGEKKFEQARGDDKENYHFVECSYGTFQRALRLPFSVNPDEVRADFQNGVLTVIVPKSAQQQRSRKIQIGGGRSAEQRQVGSADEQGGDVGREAPMERRSPSGDDQQIAH
jgi:HSP20 family protein